MNLFTKNIVRFLLFSIIIICSLSIYGQLADIPKLINWYGSIAMSIPTSICFILNAIVVIILIRKPSKKWFDIGK